MPSLLGTSLSALLVFQRALELTSQNIANANTPGYTRQVADLTARLGTGSGKIQFGSGTQISAIRRIYDALLVDQLRESATGQARFSALNGLAGRVDILLANADTGLSTSLLSYFNGLQDVANDPGSTPIRQAVLGEADGLASRFRAMDQRMQALELELNGRVRLAVDDINRLAETIANLNDKIARAGIEAQPNELLDERDRALLGLSILVSVSTINQKDGSVSVFIGSGQSLVLGTIVQRLDVRGSEFDPTRAIVVYEGVSGVTPIDTALSGGTLGGLLEFRSRMLDPTRQALGQTAVAFVIGINEQHHDGMDLGGNLGGDLFSIDAPTSLYSAFNTGSGVAVAAVDDLGSFTAADYILEYDGATYGLTRVDTGLVVPMSGSGTAADPFRADGIRIEVSGAPAAGDRVMIRTGHYVAGSVQNAISDPRALALSAPTRAQSSSTNIGNGIISATTVIDSSDPSLLTTSLIEFTDPTTYSINGAGSFAFVEGVPIIINGASVTITGAPSTGDQFTIEPNFAASGDNSNALLMTGLQSLGLLDGGTISINESYAELVADVGGTTHQIRSGLDAQNVIFANAENAVLSLSGVNLDEEAANLIRYQQAYQAAAQVVAITKTLFDTLLRATSR